METCICGQEQERVRVCLTTNVECSVCCKLGHTTLCHIDTQLALGGLKQTEYSCNTATVLSMLMGTLVLELYDSYRA